MGDCLNIGIKRVNGSMNQSVWATMIADPAQSAWSQYFLEDQVVCVPREMREVEDAVNLIRYFDGTLVEEIAIQAVYQHGR